MDNRKRADLAIAALRAGDPVTAIMYATDVIGSGMEETRAHLIAGIGMTMAGDWQAGESHLLQALVGDLSELKPHALYNLAICYEHQARADLAASLYSAAATEFRDAGNSAAAAAAHHNACWALVCRGNLDAALQHFGEADGEPSVGLEHTALAAYLALQAGNTDTALTLAGELCESCAKPWPLALACLVAGTIEIQRGDADTAELHYQRGRSLLLDARDTRLMNLYVGLRRSL